MAPRKSATTTTADARRTSASAKGFTAEERAAMRERARELKSSDAEADLRARIAEMPASDRVMAERIHDIVMSAAPGVTARTWYGMPAYAKDGNVVCFFQSAQKFKSRYAMLGFSDKANLDDGAVWPVYYALKELNDADARKIAALVKRALS
jgi:uncharacterized protein YdhG (YjbR/CyaY superfamily)